LWNANAERSISPRRNASNRQQLGQLGEALAARYLCRQGYRIIAERWRPQGKLRGELDLIALDGDQVVFVEVKTRQGTGFGRPEEAVGWQKQRQLIRLAQAWLAQQGRPASTYRIDVIAVLLVGRQARIRHLTNAVVGQ
jgi:putative endonuclease